MVWWMKQGMKSEWLGEMEGKGVVLMQDNPAQSWRCQDEDCNSFIFL